MHRLNNCCCGCMSLKTGALVLGWLSVIGAGLSILSTIKELAQIEYFIDAIKQALDQDNQMECDESCISIIRKSMYGALSVALILDIIVVTVSSLLLYGINKNRPGLMTPYIVYSFGAVGFLSVVTLIVTILFFYLGIPIAAIVFFLIMGVSLFLGFYFAWVVKSHQDEIRETMGSMSIRLQEEAPAYQAPPPYVYKE